MSAVPALRLAPATFLGYQKLEDARCSAVYELWVLTADIPDHPQGSTVVRETLEEAGFLVPLPELPLPS